MVSSRYAARIKDSPIYRLEGETLTVPASNGTRSAYNVRPGYSEILVEPVLAMRMQLVPAIKGLYFKRATGDYRDLLGVTPIIFDRAVGVSTIALSAMTSSDYLYVGTVGITGGFVVDIGATVNANAATLTAQYSDSLRAWSTLTIASDGSSSGGATFAQDGLVLVTVPSDWTPHSLADIVSGAPATRPLYWARYIVNATLTTAMLLRNLTPVAEIGAGIDNVAALTGGVWLKAVTEYTMDVHEDIGALEIMAVAAGATTARVSWIAR